MSSLPQTKATFAHLSVADQLAYVKHEIASLSILVGMIEAIVSQPEDRDLVWERLPSGQFAWLKADLTAKDRGPM